MTFFWNLSPNYQSSLVFLYVNSLYASLFLESLSLAYNEVQLYMQKIQTRHALKLQWHCGLCNAKGQSLARTAHTHTNTRTHTCTLIIVTL